MLKRSLTAFAISVMAIFGSAAADDMKYREILREDFSRFTAGSEERPSANTVNDNLQYIPESKTLTPGWQGVEIYQAGGVAYQGAGGRLFTPDLDLSQNGGSFRVSFRMKLASGSPEGYANVIHSNISSHMDKKLSEEWQTIVIEFSGGVRNDYLCIRGVDALSPNQSQVKVFIDDIIVEVPDPDLPTPDAVTYGDFDGSSFTASWHRVASAEKYELHLFTYAANGQPEYVSGNFSTESTSYHFSNLDEKWSAYYLQVRAIAGNSSSPWSAPLLIEGLATPELNDEEDVTENSFTASWTSVPGAYNYDLSAYYCHTATDDEQFYHINTDFGFVKQIDLGSQFDVGFEELPGWFFGAADLQDGYIGIQGAFAYLGYAAQIESPALYLASSGGKISVEFKAKNDDNRTGLAVALYNPQNGDFTLADSYETELSKNWYTVKASLSGGIDGSILAIIPTRSGNVYIDDLKAWQNIKTGVVGRRTAATVSTSKTYALVNNLVCQESDYVGYKVRTVGISADKTRWLYSAYTDIRYPYGNAASVDETIINGDKPVITVDGLTINVSGSGNVVVYDINGRNIVSGQCGTPFNLPRAGLYLIHVGSYSTKIIVR